MNLTLCPHNPIYLDQTGVCLDCGALLGVDRDPTVEEDDDDEEDTDSWPEDEDDEGEPVENMDHIPEMTRVELCGGGMADGGAVDVPVFLDWICVKRQGIGWDVYCRADENLFWFVGSRRRKCGVDVAFV